MVDIKGKVIDGKRRGKDLGFPTANVSLSGGEEEGIYISYAVVNNKKMPSLTFIGAAVTFGEKEVQAETYILDFDENLYGKEIEIELLKRIRDNKKFDTKEELIRQMEKDKIEAEEYFKNV